MAATDIDYELTYFDIRGRAEVIRFIFAQAGVKYKDTRIPFQDWPTVKPKTPYGTLPTLKIDGGKLLGGSRPIARFLAERYGLAGSNEIEKAELDGLMDYLDDFNSLVNRHTMEGDEARKKELLRALSEEHIPRILGVLEKMIVANDSPDGWVKGSKVTYGDLRVCATAGVMKDMAGEKALDGYPAVNRLIKAVENLPNIAKWIEERPKNLY